MTKSAINSDKIKGIKAKQRSTYEKLFGPYSKNHNFKINTEYAAQIIREHTKLAETPETEPFHSGFDWWMFPSKTQNQSKQEYNITPTDYKLLAQDREFCDFYFKSVMAYLDACEQSPSYSKEKPFSGYPVRFNKMIESLIGLTNGGTRDLAIKKSQQNELIKRVYNFPTRQLQSYASDLLTDIDAENKLSLLYKKATAPTKPDNLSHFEQSLQSKTAIVDQEAIAQGALLSDHVMIKGDIVYGDMTTSLYSWNIMKRCKSRATHTQEIRKKDPTAKEINFSNNPIDLDENQEQYQHRWSKQKQLILDTLTKEEPAFFNLQEAEGVFKYDKTNQKYALSDKDFVESLKSAGYAIAFADDVNDMAIIYDAKKYELKQTLSKNKRVIISTFTDQQNQRKIAIGNMHLKYGKNQTDYLRTVKEAAQDLPLFIAGDANHIPKQKSGGEKNEDAIAGLVINSENATCFDQEGSNYDKFTISHAGKAKKAYDGFIVFHKNQNQPITITEGERFAPEINTDGKLVMKRTNQKQHVVDMKRKDRFKEEEQPTQNQDPQIPQAGAQKKPEPVTPTQTGVQNIATKSTAPTQTQTLEKQPAPSTIENPAAKTGTQIELLKKQPAKELPKPAEEPKETAEEPQNQEPAEENPTEEPKKPAEEPKKPAEELPKSEEEKKEREEIDTIINFQAQAAENGKLLSDLNYEQFKSIFPTKSKENPIAGKIIAEISKDQQKLENFKKCADNYILQTSNAVYINWKGNLRTKGDDKKLSHLEESLQNFPNDTKDLLDKTANLKKSFAQAAIPSAEDISLAESIAEMAQRRRKFLLENENIAPTAFISNKVAKDEDYLAAKTMKPAHLTCDDVAKIKEKAENGYFKIGKVKEREMAFHINGNEVQLGYFNKENEFKELATKEGRYTELALKMTKDRLQGKEIKQPNLTTPTAPIKPAIKSLSPTPKKEETASLAAVNELVGEAAGALGKAKEDLSRKPEPLRRNSDYLGERGEITDLADEVTPHLTHGNLDKLNKHSATIVDDNEKIRKWARSVPVEKDSNYGVGR